MSTSYAPPAEVAQMLLVSRIACMCSFVVGVAGMFLLSWSSSHHALCCASSQFSVSSEHPQCSAFQRASRKANVMFLFHMHC